MCSKSFPNRMVTPVEGALGEECALLLELQC